MSEQYLLQEEEVDQDVEMSEEAGAQGANEIILSDQNQTLTPNRKMLIQRVFHLSDAHTVEEKSNYVIVDSEEEITKLVYGGLFRGKYYKYCPENYCKKHAPNLFELEDETLVRLGDKFESLECFRLYIDGNARSWKYYLKCADSHRKNGMDSFVFQCVFAKTRSRHSASKGLRKRTFAVPRCECPCRVILKPVPFDAKDLTVIYVCNHHDHPLTEEYFSKLQHGRRIHPRIKEELMDLLSLEVDREIVKKYFESLTGYSMSYTFFNNMIIRMKKNKMERRISYEKLKEMYKKIEKIQEDMGLNGDIEDNVDNDLMIHDNTIKDKASQVVEAINVLKAVSTKKRYLKRAKRREQDSEKPNKRQRKGQGTVQDTDGNALQPQVENSRSRLEARLHELRHDRETLQSIRHLQDSVRCETQDNPWVNDQTPAPHNISRPSKRAKKVQELTPVILPQVVSEDIVIETPQIDETFVPNQENEITVMNATVEECPDTIGNCVQVVDCNEINLDGNVSYCIQYDENGKEIDNESNQIVLMFEEDPNLEDVPEVQIRATEFATVSITSDNNQTNDNKVGQPEHDIETRNESHLHVTSNIQVVDTTCCDNPEDIEEKVYELIQTNDKKVLPRKEIVDTVILNKPKPPPKQTSKRVQRIYNDTIPKDLKNKFGKNKRTDWSIENSVHSRTHRKTKLASRHDNDVITQYFKEKSEEYMKDIFKSDLDNLDEDECYMIVVENDGNKNSDDEDGYRNWVENLEKYDRLNGEEVLTTKFERDESESEIYIKVDSEGLEEDDNVSENLDEGTCNEQDESESSVSYGRIQTNKEKDELERAVYRLKRQKLALERDIEELVATKDDLIEDITTASRIAKRK